MLNPIDWCDIELTKTDQGAYIWVNVVSGAGSQLWRLPVVDTNAMAAGKFMVGAFNMAAQVFDREDANVQVSTEDGDNFVKNMVTGAALATINRLPVLLIPGDIFAGHGPDPVLQQLEVSWAGDVSVNDAFRAVAPKVDDYFARTRLAAFDPRAEAAVNGTDAAFVTLPRIRPPRESCASMPLRPAVSVTDTGVAAE